MSWIKVCDLNYKKKTKKTPPLKNEFTEKEKTKIATKIVELNVKKKKGS